MAPWGALGQAVEARTLKPCLRLASHGKRLEALGTTIPTSAACARSGQNAVQKSCQIQTTPGVL